jgi:RimJ/RimL family protein N-acetyltransferase/aryl carrier-like protein
MSTYRSELAELLDRDPDTMPDELRLADSLDSLGMMGVLVWLESRGVTISDDRARPVTVGDVLALLDRSAPRLSINIGPVAGETGPTSVPALPAPVSPLTPVLTSGGFSLTPVQPGDTEFLYWLASLPETCFRWRYRGVPPAYDRFVADLWARVLVQFVVRREADGEPVGHVVAYAADSTMRHAYVGAVFVPAHNGTGVAAQSVRAFVDYLFHTFPLFKLYLEVPGYNWAQLESGAGRLFEVEGVLRGHDYYAGQYWDKRVCAIYRERA